MHVHTYSIYSIYSTCNIYSIYSTYSTYSTCTHVEPDQTPAGGGCTVFPLMSRESGCCKQWLPCGVTTEA